MIHEDAFDPLTNLGTLYLDNNNIEMIHEDAFDPLTNLGTLYLDNNNIESLHEDTFDSTTGLQWLLLRNNRITSLHADIFENTTNLLGVYLSGNSLTSLDEDIFESTPYLLAVYLSGNSLASLPVDIFDGLSTLDRLALADMSLASLDPDIFDGLTALTWLFLTDNGIADLPANIFDDLTSLSELDLSCNSLTALDLTRFDPFAASLTFLDITGNDFTTNPADAAVRAKLTAIDKLYISETNTGCLTPSITSLSAVTYSTGGTSLALTASLRPATSYYQVEVDHDVTSITVTPTTTDPLALITLGNEGPDNDPDTPGIQRDVFHVRTLVDWFVTARNGGRPVRYYMYVLRAHPPATNAQLRGLTLSGIPLTREFDSGAYTYTATETTGLTQTEVTPVLSDSEASYVIKLGGTVDEDGTVSLAQDANSVITVEVTAEDGVTKNTYQVIVYRRYPGGQAGPHIVIAASKRVYDPSGGNRKHDERDLIIALYNLESDATWSGDNYSGDFSTLDYVHRTDILHADGRTTLKALDLRNECEGPALFERNHIQMSVDREIRKVNENPETRDGGVVDVGNCVNDFAVTVTVWGGAAFQSQGREAAPYVQLTCRFDGVDSVGDDFAALDWNGEQTGPGWYYHRYVLCTDSNWDLAPDSMPTIPALNWEPPE